MRWPVSGPPTGCKLNAACTRLSQAMYSNCSGALHGAKRLNSQAQISLEKDSKASPAEGGLPASVFCTFGHLTLKIRTKIELKSLFLNGHPLQHKNVAGQW